MHCYTKRHSQKIYFDKRKNVFYSTDIRRNGVFLVISCFSSCSFYCRSTSSCCCCCCCFSVQVGNALGGHKTDKRPRKTQRKVRAQRIQLWEHTEQNNKKTECFRATTKTTLGIVIPPFNMCMWIKSQALFLPQLYRYDKKMCVAGVLYSMVGGPQTQLHIFMFLNTWKSFRLLQKAHKLRERRQADICIVTSSSTTFLSQHNESLFSNSFKHTRKTYFSASKRHRFWWLNGSWISELYPNSLLQFTFFLATYKRNINCSMKNLLLID